MEKGQMRIEANISVAPVAKSDLVTQSTTSHQSLEALGVKVEVKNLNSFKSVEKAIDFEITRQIKVLEGGEKVVQETRGWDENKQITFSQRLKESSHDYRYFPEPDLPKLFLSEISEFSETEIEKSLPELPWQRRARFATDFGLKAEDAEVFVQDHKLAEFFRAVAETVDLSLETAKAYLQTAANYLTTDLLGLAATPEELVLPEPADYAELIKMVTSREISSRGAKDILALMIRDGGEPRKIAEEHGLLQVHDEGAISVIIDKIIADHKDVFSEFKNGKEKSLQFLVGQAMKESKGAANPEILKKLFITRAQ
jgi:aspartyl-tRNA(Asn)/glutamyl-tRNA(Gln) amidotransferase subunit B